VNVLHVDSAAGWRGGQNQVLLTAKGMAARGHRVALACRSGGVLEARARAEGLDVHGLPLAGDLSPRAAFQLSGLMRRYRPEVLHLHDPHALAAGILAARVGRAAPEARAVATRRVDFPLRGPLSRLKYRSCAQVIAVSRKIAGVLAAGGVAPERIRVVYEGVPDRPAAPGGREALADLGVPAGCPVVGNVAALTDHKDHATLIEAASLVRARVPEARFVIVGDGPLRPRLEALARERGVGDRCLFAGFRQDLDRLFPAFTVFCLSSHMEGLGTSLLDAMAFSRPVVATAAGGIPEAVEDGVTGRVVPVRDPAALADALAEVLTDAGKAQAMGSAGRRRFEERFTAERMVDETLAAYERAR
jgi:glycosyltransferase involved in cell wall biosynthesis